MTFVLSLLARYGIAATPFMLKAALAGALALGVGAWFAKKQYDAYQRGKTAVIEKVNKETEKVKDAWEKIDDQRPDLDAALRRLRNQ